MEINITELFLEAGPMEFSASCVELGDNAGEITWNNAVAAPYQLLKDDSEREAAREWAAEFGAWDESEIAAWSNDELNALLIQYVAGDIREATSLLNCDVESFDWDGYRELSEQGKIGGSMFETAGGEVYFSIA